MANKKIAGAAKAGLGLAALAGTAGAYYFYGSKHAAQHRKKMKSWMIKAKGDVVERVENLQDASQAAYNKAVDEVMFRYQKVKEIDPKEIQAMAADLKKHWKNIRKHVKAIAQPAVKARPKTPKRR